VGGEKALTSVQKNRSFGKSRTM